MKEIRVFKRDGHELSQDVAGCVAILKQAKIWAHAGVVEYGKWHTISIISALPQAIALLRANGFEVDEGSKPRSPI
jgi:hypothetical protein